MKKPKTITFALLLVILFVFPFQIFSQTNSKTVVTMKTNPSTQKSDTMMQIFIDRFIVPKEAKQEFTERMNFNRNFIKKLPGFIEDSAYERTDDQGNFICVTIAVWENEAFIKKAKEAVQAEYQKQGFNLQEMLKRLNIVIDRGIYKKTMN